MVYSDDIEHSANLLYYNCINREDIISVQAPWGTPCPAVPDSDFVDLLMAHVGGADYGPVQVTLAYNTTRVPFAGPLRLGTYFPHPSGKVILACIDFDDHGNDNSLCDPFNAAYDTCRAAEHWGLSPYIELSGGGRGIHLWLFFDMMLCADQVRSVLLHLIPKGLKMAGGETANPERSIGVEIFPKSSRVAKGGVGSAVWLPLWHGAEGDATQFFRLVDGGEREFYVPESFTKSVIPSDLITFAEDDRIRRVPVTSVAGPKKAKYQAARIEILNRLDLQEFYSPFLTGRILAPGYLECRDPWAANGDHHPSASVQTGEAGTVRGRFFSFIRQEPMSPFDFLMKTDGNGIDTFTQALRFLAKTTGVPLA